MDSRVNFPIPSQYPSWQAWATQLGVVFSAMLGQTPDDQLPFVLLQETQPSGTNAGTFTAGAWQLRPQTLIQDLVGICRISAGTFRLPKGRYIVWASAPAFSVTDHQARIYNVTDGSVVLLGTSEYAPANTQTRSMIYGTFVLRAEKVLRLEHRCATTENSDGFGRAAGFGTEVYSAVELWGIV